LRQGVPARATRPRRARVTNSPGHHERKCGRWATQSVQNGQRGTGFGTRLSRSHLICGAWNGLKPSPVPDVTPSGSAVNRRVVGSSPTRGVGKPREHGAFPCQHCLGHCDANCDDGARSGHNGDVDAGDNHALAHVKRRVGTVSVPTPISGHVAAHDVDRAKTRGDPRVDRVHEGTRIADRAVVSDWLAVLDEKARPRAGANEHRFFPPVAPSGVSVSSMTFPASAHVNWPASSHPSFRRCQANRSIGRKTLPMKSHVPTAA
jgi:hypothetical protein